MALGGGRTKRGDLDSFYKTREDLLKDYLELRMDGSAIFAIYKREFLLKKEIYFTKHFHEDIYFMFLVYFHSSNIGIINKPLYSKRPYSTSITHSCSKKHIDGFLLAYEKIRLFLKQDSKYLISYNRGLVGVIAILIRNIYLYGENKIELYAYLFSFIKNLKIDESIFDIETKYLKLYKALLNDAFSPEFLSKIEKILKSSWSCYDLHNSLFLASKEIRACCKRFFVNGVKKGDVVLCKIDSNEEEIVEKILESKKSLFKRINSSLAHECYGCPHLEFKNWEPIEKLKIEKISFEYHSVCNLRCIYCSPKYYGGMKPIYNVEKVVKKLINTKALQSCKSIVWGGGEPSLDHNFDASIETIGEALNIKQMIITNAIKYSPSLQKLLDSNKARITTSIDAGTKNSFKKIRGADKLNTTLENLVLYSKNRPRNVTIKYIFLEENSKEEELLSFVKLIKDYGLGECNFHLSCNFNEEKISLDLLARICFLFSLLVKMGGKVVFFDELLRERIPLLSKEDLAYVKKFLSKNNLEEFLEDPKKYQKKLCIWGYNTNTKLLLQKSLFLREFEELHIIDSDYKNIEIKENLEIKDPLIFKNSDYPILISAVQGSPRIYEEFIKKGFSIKRLIRGVVF